MSLKNPVTPLGIDPGTFRLIAQLIFCKVRDKIEETIDRPNIIDNFSFYGIWMFKKD